jgi:anaerobic nitric oxide reductase transcription regulator
MEQRANQLDVLMEIARDLTASLAAEDRYHRLLNAVTRVIPCDAACLLRLEGDDLVPVAGRGLAQEALIRRFNRHDHPRLDEVLRSADPVLFPADSALADPFDGLLRSDPQAQLKVHACLGCRLTEGSEVVGALTADALQPQSFESIDRHMLQMLGALAGAAMRTTALIEALEQVAERRGAVARELHRSAGSDSGGQILGCSAVVRRLLEEIRTVAGSDLPVLITGETGVGKELVARQIHDLSSRRDEAMIHVNCAALPESVAESELFGHVKGAFTGAVRDRAGKFEIAHGGTLFLDEIGELPLSLQPKLLRAIQQGEVQRVGSDRAIRLGVRVIAATNRDLAVAMEQGRFRADLYHRLAVYPIHVRPLRDRR